MKYEGFYFDRKNWEIKVNPEKIENSIKIPTIAMLAAAPLMGGLFVMFLPLLGFYMVGKHAVRSMFAKDATKSRPKSISV